MFDEEELSAILAVPAYLNGHGIYEFGLDRAIPGHGYSNDKEFCVKFAPPTIPKPRSHISPSIR